MPKNYDEGSFDSLFDYVSKNTIITDALNKISSSNPQVLEFLDAVETGKPEANIFQDRNCQLYLLHLIKAGKIKFWHGMTVYVFLIALAQFTNKQPLKESDENYKLLGDMKSIPLVKDGKITKEGNEYCKIVTDRFKELHIVINRISLEQLILTLPIFEQQLLQIPLTATPLVEYLGYKHLRDALIANLAILQKVEQSHEYSSKFVLIPSISLIIYFLTKVQPESEPIVMRPIFGRIGNDTLAKLHRQGEHPIALYSLFVKNNMLNTHKCPHPFWILLHDIGHTFWGSLFTLQEREQLFNCFIPELTKWESYALKSDIELSKNIKFIIEAALDFDLTPISEFSHPEERFILYLTKTFRIDLKHPIYWLFNNELYLKTHGAPFEKIGIIHDKLYFLLCKTAYLLERDKLNNIFSKILAVIDDNLTQENRNPSIIKALRVMAKNVIINNVQLKLTGKAIKSAEQYLAWKKFLNTLLKVSNEEILWKKILENHHDTLLELIEKYNFTLFPPFVLLTDAKRIELIKFLQYEIQCTDQQLARDSEAFHSYPTLRV